MRSFPKFTSIISENEVEKIRMNILFEGNQYRPILRLYLPFWNAEKIMADTVVYCKGTGIRDLLLFSDAQYLAWNQLSRDAVLRECTVLTGAVKYFK